MPNRQAIEQEIRSILIRHLPVGLEGIGIAQTQAVVRMLDRHSAGRSAVDSDQRKGMVLLAATAQAHASSATFTPDNEGHCGMCRSEDSSSPVWPCSVWTSAELLGLVSPDDHCFRFAG